MAMADDYESDAIVRAEARRRGLTETEYRMLKAAPNSVVHDIVFDHVGKRDVLQPSSIIPENNRSTPVERGTGWIDPRKLDKQPGIDLIDKMCLNADMQERLKAAEERRRAALDAIELEERLKRKPKKD
jgi:hypothetical protein